jgi:hypothetical protein
MATEVYELSDDEAKIFEETVEKLFLIALHTDLQAPLISAAMVAAFANLHVSFKGLTPSQHAEFMNYLHKVIITETSRVCDDYIRSLN